MRQSLHKMGTAFGLALLWVYRNCISPLKPACCRFDPTCSSYARTAVLRFGLVRGSWLAARRLARCHPFYRGPLCDPVPELPGPPASSKLTRHTV